MEKFDEEEEQVGGGYYDIDRYPGKGPQIVMLESQQQAAIIRISEAFFECTYQYGCKQDKQRLGIDKAIKKYYNRRFFLFSKFGEGIQLDRQSWYSVVAEPISLYLKDRLMNSKLRLKTIFEPFSGVGGITVHLSSLAEEKYIANDLDPAKIDMLKNNLSIYGTCLETLEILNKDFLAIEPFECDLIILCPPWGGINLQTYGTHPLDDIMNPKLSLILSHAIKFSKNIILQMPKNTNIINLLTSISQSYGAPTAQIQKMMIDTQNSQLFIFLGAEQLTRLMYSTVYELLWGYFQVDTKQGKNAIKMKYREDTSKLLKEVYKHEGHDKSKQTRKKMKKI